MHSEQNRIGLSSIAFDCFDNRTHSKLDVRFCSIAEPNRTIGVRLKFGSILFDWIPRVILNPVFSLSGEVSVHLHLIKHL